MTTFRWKPVASLTLILLGLGLALNTWKPEWLYPSAWAIGLFFVGLVLVIQVLGDKARKDKDLGSQILLALRVGHMLLSLIFCGLFIFFDRENAFVFVGNFFLAYLLAVTFEIRGLVANLRSDFGQTHP